MGDIDTAKTTSPRRTGAVLPKNADLLKESMGLVDDRKEAWMFASESPGTPMGRHNVSYRNMKPRLDPIGLGLGEFSGAASEAGRPRPCG